MQKQGVSTDLLAKVKVMIDRFIRQNPNSLTVEFAQKKLSREWPYRTLNSYLTVTLLSSVFSKLDFEMVVSWGDLFSSSYVVEVFQSLKWSILQLTGFDNLLKARDHEILLSICNLPSEVWFQDPLGTLYLSDGRKDKKSSGQIFTPPSVSGFIVNTVYEIIRQKKTKILTVIDPACGSGRFIIDLLINYPSNIDELHITGIDLDPEVIRIAQLNITLFRQHFAKTKKLKLQFIHGNFLTLSQITPVDVVIGNPPYIRKEKLSNEIREELKRYFPNYYHGDADLFNYFFIKSLEVLKEDGLIGFITSNKFLRTRYGKDFRKELARRGHISLLAESPNFFSGVLVDSLIMIFQKGINAEESLYFKVEGENPTATIEELLTKHRKIKDTGKETSSSYFLPRNALSVNGKWSIVSRERKHILALLESRAITSLGKIAEIYYGIKPGNIGVFVIPKSHADELKIPKEFQWPILRGKDIHPYVISSSDKILIFPYRQKPNGTFERIKLNEVPALKNYLEPHHSQLEQRSDIRYSPSRKWFELRPCRYYSAFKPIKIITPDFAHRNSFAIDEDGFITLDTCFIIIPTPDAPPIHALLAYLNSSVAEFYIQSFATSLGRKEFRYKKQYLVQIPIPNLTAQSPTIQRLIELAKEATVKSSSVSIKEEIDELIFDLFSLKQKRRFYIKSKTLEQRSNKK